jgi:uncharacterized repeat protein (TIGR01451 family)
MSSMGFSRRRRNLTVAAAALAGGLIFLVAGALADAGNPILGTIKATAVDNHDGTVTIYVRGQWNWLSHGSDCNSDRNGTGVGVIWSDPTETGYVVTNGVISAQVGVKTKNVGGQWPTDPNLLDQMVHPADRGNQVEGYTVSGTDYPAGQQFVDPSPPGITALQQNLWRGGCGRLPLNATASKGANPERSGRTCGTNPATLTCSGHPWGSWGYEKNGGLGYSHTYLKTLPNGQSGLPSKVCVNFYDVHGNNAGRQAPGGTDEIDVDGNGNGNHDNSIQTNDFNVNDGANCISVVATATTTDIHNASHTVVTVVEAGAPATVHDFVSVTAPGHPTPTGQVNIDWFTNNTCTVPVDDTSANLTLDANGHVDSAPSFVKGPLAPGLYGFKAHYLGDNGLYLPSDGPCEPLRVVDANIQINPPTATNEVGSPHVLTAHVNLNDGNGSANAPAGTTINFTKVSGPGNLSAASCLTVLATGSCQVTLTSSTAGVTTINAATDVTVGGLPLHRATGDAHAGDSANAQKTFVDANIQINPPSATNEVGSPHVLTAHVNVNDGTGFGNAPAGTTINFTKVSGPGALSAASCLTVLATGSCQVTLTSSTAGVTTINAATDVTVRGLPLHRATGDAHADDSANAQKTFVDANIQINPPSAINPVSTNHVFTAHVNVNDGTGFANAPNGTQISFTIDSGPGSFTTTNPCTTAGGTGSCSITLTSATPGTSVVSAHVTVVVGGLSLTRHTNGTGSNSGAATKLFADDTVRTDILNAADGVVTTVVAGTIVHDKVFVAKTAATPAAVPNPTGNVIFHRYATFDCTGTATDQTVVLTSGSPSTALSDAFAPTANMSYKADYLGDANYPARSGACEPLTVTPVPAPAIAIVKNPKSQTAAVGGTATFTITVTNAGNTALTNVTVTDPLSPNCNRTSAQIPALASMAPGATVTYTCTRPNVRASFDNVATATGTPPSGPNVTASDTAPVKVQALTPAKKKVVKKKKPKVVSHKKPKATG